MKKSRPMNFNRTVDLLKKMHQSNCGVKLKSKEESLDFLQERVKEFKLQKNEDSLEAKLLKLTLLAASRN
jgi:hypothetical protein